MTYHQEVPEQHLVFLCVYSCIPISVCTAKLQPLPLFCYQLHTSKSFFPPMVKTFPAITFYQHNEPTNNIKMIIIHFAENMLFMAPIFIAFDVSTCHCKPSSHTCIVVCDQGLPSQVKRSKVSNNTCSKFSTIYYYR